ncbi:MAG: undecaprenyl-diphosphate phosphatase [Candidatus Omnitrophica bacterium]|nr:undecaprenyl-diphosphate phosphatase [Candidatus Omnitrophota bacterium]
MSAWQAIISGAIQGLTEFLPISSSGHLVVSHHLFGLTTPQLVFDIYLHCATLIPIFVVFRKDIAAALRNVDGLGVLVVIATCVTFLAALPCKHFFIEAFHNPRLVGCMLGITGVLLLTTAVFQNRKRAGNASSKKIGVPQAIIIGLVQACAIMPGISRSGATIATALLLGSCPTEAVRFSFLLSIPAVIAAVAWSLKGAGDGGIHPTAPYIFGFIAALVTGWIALQIVIMSVERRKLHFFGIYCIILSAVIVVSV